MRSAHPHIDLLLQHALGEVSGARLEELEAHLLNCDSCGARLHEFETLLWQYRRAPAPRPPEQLLANLLEAQAAARRPASTRVKHLLGRALAWAAIFVAGFLLGRGRGDIPAPTPTTERTALRGAPLPHPPTVSFYPAVMRDSDWRPPSGGGEADSL